MLKPYSFRGVHAGYTIFKPVNTAGASGPDAPLKMVLSNRRSMAVEGEVVKAWPLTIRAEMAALIESGDMLVYDEYGNALYSDQVLDFNPAFTFNYLWPDNLVNWAVGIEFPGCYYTVDLLSLRNVAGGIRRFGVGPVLKLANWVAGQWIDATTTYVALTSMAQAATSTLFRNEVIHTAPAGPPAPMVFNIPPNILHTPIVPGSIDITYEETPGMVLTITDDGAGNLIGDVAPGGTVDYATGALVGTTSNNVFTLTDIIVSIYDAEFPVSTLVANDGHIIGSTSQFNAIRYVVALAADAAGVYAYEYWNGAAWAVLPLTYALPDFTALGAQELLFNPPADWAVTTAPAGVNVPLGIFAIRIRATVPPAVTEAGVHGGLVGFPFKYLPTDVAAATTEQYGPGLALTVTGEGEALCAAWEPACAGNIATIGGNCNKT